MLGLVRGVVADGTVTADEARRLSDWSRANPEVATHWPANLLARRLERIFADGKVEPGERARLSTILSRLVDDAGAPPDFMLATDLPLTRPPPEVTFEGKTFVFAGDFVYGPTRTCEREVLDLGGRCERTVTRRTDYLVIGAIAAMDWAQRDFGALVDEAILHRTRGVPVAVITEERWAEALP